MIDGFKFNGINCGIKKNKLDLGLVYSSDGAILAGVTTKNKFKSPSVTYLNQAIKSSNKINLLALNSGNANALTGENGYKDILNFLQSIETKYDIPPDNSLLLSTGIIGKRLPIDIMEKNIPNLNEFDSNKYNLFAEAILTTDLKTKIFKKTININNEKIDFLGIAKGSGMIRPNMATMHALIFTNATIDKKDLQNTITLSSNNSFNKITIDGDCSTNDSFLILSSCKTKTKINKTNLDKFQEGLDEVSIYLAKQIILDGEGATKFVEIEVTGGATLTESKNIFYAVANSPLVKTAIFGENPNFGRIIVAAGTVESTIISEKVELYLGQHLLVKENTALENDKSILDNYMKNKEIKITLNLNNGSHNFTGWTCDYSYDYIKINAEYN